MKYRCVITRQPDGRITLEKAMGDGSCFVVDQVKDAPGWLQQMHTLRLFLTAAERMMGKGPGTHSVWTSDWADEA